MPEHNEPQDLARREYSEEELEKGARQIQERSFAELNLPETAELKLDRLEEAVRDISTITPRITFELYKTNNEEYHGLIAEVEQKLAAIEALMVAFETTIQIEYPQVPWTQKAVVFCLALVRSHIRESTLIQTFGGNTGKREALTHALAEFRRLLEEQRQRAQKVEEELNLPIRVRQQAILEQNVNYRMAVIGLRDEKARVHGTLLQGPAAGEYYAKLDKYSSEIKRLEDAAWLQAKQEFEAEIAKHNS